MEPELLLRLLSKGLCPKFGVRSTNKFWLQNLYPAHNFMYYVYLLKNRVKGEIYIGYSENLRRRLGEHKIKKPELVYYEAYKFKKDARVREGKLKQHGQAKRRLKERLQHSFV